jgi:tRNA(Ile)-lysidine synthase
MLTVRRNEVLDYIREHDLKFREDSTNLDTSFLRNRIRHELLPLLEREFNPSIRETLLRTAEILRDEDFYLLHHVAERFYMAICQNDVVNIKALANCPVAVQRRVLRFWLGGESEVGSSFAFEQIEAIRNIARGDSPSAEVNLPDSLVVYREYEQLKKAKREELEPVRGKWPLNVEGETHIRELGVQLESEIVGQAARLPVFGPGNRAGCPTTALAECFDAAVLGESPFIRTWQEGDRFQPLGMTEEKKLQDYFVDEKVPRRNRGRVPLLCATDGRIAWVVGYRMAEPFKVTGQTRQAVRIKAGPVRS